MKIALLNLGRINNAYGGTEKVFFDMANNLSRLGHHVIAIVHDTHLVAPCFPIDEAVKYINCKVDPWTNIQSQLLRRILPVFQTKTKRINTKLFQKYLPRAKKIKQVLDEEKPDVLVTFQALATYVVIDMIKTTIPVITMFHVNPGCFDSDESKLYHSALLKSAAIQVLMPEFAQNLKSLFSIPNIVTLPNIVPQNVHYSLLKNPVIINVARLCRTPKRQHLIVEAFNLLKDDFPNWSVELWGETKEHPGFAQELNLLIRKYKLQDRVKICGATRDVPTKLNAASIFCFPSESEGMPLAMTEAMSMGLPVVGCKACPSVNTIVRHGENGFLCDDTPEDIAAHLRILMSDIELRQKMGQQAREDMKQYSPEIIWKRWDDLLKKVHAGEPIVD